MPVIGSVFSRTSGYEGRDSRLGDRPRKTLWPGCFGVSGLGRIRRWPLSARCSSNRTGLPISPNKQLMISVIDVKSCGEGNSWIPWWYWSLVQQ